MAFSHALFTMGSCEMCKLKMGRKLGDYLISSYIFILCAEIAGKMILNSNTVRGVQKWKTVLVSQYADDMHLFLDGTEGSLKEAL